MAVVQFRNLSDNQLDTAILAARDKLSHLRTQSAAEKLRNVSLLTTLRRDLADMLAEQSARNNAHPGRKRASVGGILIACGMMQCLAAQRYLGPWWPGIWLEMLFFFIAGGSLLWSAARARPRAMTGHCTNCHLDLMSLAAGNPCPECGALR